MSKPLAMNMYSQNASGVWIPTTTATPADGVTNPTNILAVESFPMAWNGTAWQRALNASYNTDNNSQNDVGIITKTDIYDFNGGGWDRHRSPATFKTATATASGDTAVWTPTSGKKFRLMKYVIYVTANAAAAAAGVLEILLRDATTPLGLAYSAFIPSAAGAVIGTDNSSGPIDLGNGPLSAVANNALNINLSFALTAGEVRVVAIGTEE